MGNKLSIVELLEACYLHEQEYVMGRAFCCGIIIERGGFVAMRSVWHSTRIHDFKE